MNKLFLFVMLSLFLSVPLTFSQVTAPSASVASQTTPVIVPSVAVKVVPVAVAPVIVDDSALEFIDAIAATIKKFGGASTFVKISLILLLLVGSMKVSFLNKYVWDKLGAARVWVAPLLGLIAGFLAPLASGQSITFMGVCVYLASGVGAVALHELIKSVKSIPKLGPAYVAILDIIEAILGGKNTPAK